MAGGPPRVARARAGRLISLDGQSRDILVYDVGGTTLRASRFRPADSSLAATLRATTPSHHALAGATPTELRDRLFAEMLRLGGEVLEDRLPQAVAVAFPGPIDSAGNVLAAPTVWGDAGRATPLPLKETLAERFGPAPVFVLNDVTAAGHRYLAHANDDLCILTVSSGIGHKVFVDGRALVGPGGRGGELGHWRVDDSPDAPLCDCGGRGHLGALASGRSTAHHVARRVEADPRGFRASIVGKRAAGDPAQVTNPLLVEAYRQDDPWARSVIAPIAGWLGRTLASIHLGVGVERFVIVGGFALALGDGFRSQLARAAQAACWASGADWNRMVELGVDDDDAGLLGAGLFALRRLASP